MKRSLKPLAPLSRRIAGGVCVGGMVLALLAGMSPGTVQAVPFGRQARRSSGSPAAGFRFTDLRVQASKNTSPALRRVRSGQGFWVGIYARFWKLSRLTGPSAARNASRRAPGENPFLRVFTPRARLVCRYTVLHRDHEMLSKAQPVDLTMDDGSVATTFPAIFITLPDGVRENTYQIRATVAMNGVTQTRTTFFTVYR
jgi:hypothetical protein